MSARARKTRLGDEYVANWKPLGKSFTIVSKQSIAERPQSPVSYRKESVLKTIADMRSELGRMAKLADQLEAEFLRASD